MSKLRRVEIHTPARVMGVTEAQGDKGPHLAIQCIAAGMSLNRTHYSEEVLKEAAPLYEGARIFLDHSWSTSVRNLAGSLDNASWSPSKGGVQADAYPATELEAGQLLLNLARAELRFRESGILDDDEALFGFSHVAWTQGEFKEDDEGEYYEIQAITEVESVDAVTFPAANGYMKSMTEGRRNQLLSLMARDPTLEAVVNEARGEPAKPKAPQRRVKMNKKTKSKAGRPTVSLDAVLGRATLEGVSRADLTPLLQEAVDEAAEVYETFYEAQLEAVRGELATAQASNVSLEAQVEEHQKVQAEAKRKEGVSELFKELAVPKGQHERFTTLFNQEGKEYSVEQARAFLEAFMAQVGTRAAEGGVEDDLEPREQESASAVDEAEEIGVAFAEEYMTPAQRERLQKRRAAA